MCAEKSTLTNLGASTESGMILCAMTTSCATTYIVAEFWQSAPLSYFNFATVVWQLNHGLSGCFNFFGFYLQFS
jgi:hypothetical protein